MKYENKARLVIVLLALLLSLLNIAAGMIFEKIENL